MSSGAITLQCPHCGGVFLTLQRGGIIEICPHCAVGAPRASFTSSSSPVGLRPRSDLPTAKRETEPPLPQSTEAAPAPLVDSPFPMAPEIPAADPPMPPSAIVQATPMAHEIVPRDPPKPEASPEESETKTAQEEPPTPPASEAEKPADAPLSPDETANLRSASWPQPDDAPLEPDSDVTRGSDAAPPIWPGLDLNEDREITIPFPTEIVPRASAPELEHRTTPKRRGPWVALAMLALLIVSVVWLILQDPRPAHVTQSDPPQASVPVGPASIPAPVPTQPTLPPEPVPEVKPAIPNGSPAEVVAIRARAAEEHFAAITDEMVKGLEGAVTNSDRLQWIDATESERADMERYFDAHHGKFEPVQLEPSAGKVTLLPSGTEMKLFRLTTTTCREGAILQVIEENGRAKMRWGLFEQSHEKIFERFLSGAENAVTTRWFTLLCQRGHSFDLKGTTKDQWICFDAQGSLGPAGTGQIYVNKDSPVGRFLGPKVEWGRLYLVELLVGKMEIDGHRLNVVLDCAGLHGGTERRK